MRLIFTWKRKRVVVPTTQRVFEAQIRHWATPASYIGSECAFCLEQDVTGRPGCNGCALRDAIYEAGIRAFCHEIPAVDEIRRAKAAKDKERMEQALARGRRWLRAAAKRGEAEDARRG